VAIFVIPPLVFIATKRACLGLQRRDRDKLLHGYESGRVLRLPHGEFIEVHQPLSQKDLAVITSKTDRSPLPAPVPADANGIRNRNFRLQSLRHRLSAFFYADNVTRPTAAEMEAGQHHAEHSAGLEAPLEAYADADVIVPGRGGSLHHPGMADTNADQQSERSSH
jgi:ubiquinol-cytochrome c reductase cytochrome b subunit